MSRINQPNRPKITVEQLCPRYVPHLFLTETTNSLTQQFIKEAYKSGALVVVRTRFKQGGKVTVSPWKICKNPIWDFFNNEYKIVESHSV